MEEPVFEPRQSGSTVLLHLCIASIKMIQKELRLRTRKVLQGADFTPAAY